MKNCIFSRRESSRGTTTYLCHRSGYANAKSVLLRKRQVKNTGTCKIGGICTAYISRKETDGMSKVFYCSTHFGHDCDLGHLRLSKDEKNMIAGRFATNYRNLYQPRSNPP